LTQIRLDRLVHAEQELVALIAHHRDENMQTIGFKLPIPRRRVSLVVDRLDDIFSGLRSGFITVNQQALIRLEATLDRAQDLIEAVSAKFSLFKCREYRHRHDMLFDAVDAGNDLGGDAQCLRFHCGAGSALAFGEAGIAAPPSRCVPARRPTR
jgi:hypothetical protein